MIPPRSKGATSTWTPGRRMRDVGDLVRLVQEEVARQAFAVEHGCHPHGAAPAVRADHDAVPGCGELAKTLREHLRVSQHGRPARGLQGDGAGALGDREQRGDLGGTMLEEAVEAQVESRDPCCGVRLGQAPGRRQALAQGHFLVQELGRPVAQAAGLDEHDSRALVEQIGEEALGGAEPGQPRLHAVEELPVRDPGEVVAGERCLLRKDPGALAHLFCEDDLAATEQLDVHEIGDRALVRHLERRQPVDLVPEQVDADRVARRRPEDVHDPAPHGKLAASLDLVLAAVSGVDEAGDEVLRVELGPPADDDRLGVFDPRAQPLQQRPDRGDDDTGRGLRAGGRAVAQAPHGPEAAAHGLGRRRHALERQRLPGRQELDRVRTEERPEVVGELLGLSRRRRGDEHRRRRAQLREGGEHDRAHGVGHGHDGVVHAEQVGDDRLPGQEAGQGGKRARAELREAHVRALNLLMATSGPSATRHSTASAATSTASAMRARVRPRGAPQDVVGPGGGVRRLAHADADADELEMTEMGLDRPETVVTRRAAPELDPDDSRLEVELVVDDDERGGREHERSPPTTALARALRLLGCEVAANEGPDGDPALVHVGLGHSQHESLAPHANHGRLGAGALLRAETGGVTLRRRGAPQPHRRCDACPRTQLPGCRAQRLERRRRARFVGRLVRRRHQSGSGWLGGGGTACPLSALVGSGRLFASGGRLASLDTFDLRLGLEGACRVGDDDRSLGIDLRRHSLGKGEIRDAKRVADLERGDVDLDDNGTSPGLALICRVSISWSTVPSAR